MSRLPTIPSIRRLRLLVATASLPALLLALPLATSAQPADAGRNNDTGMQAAIAAAKAGRLAPGQAEALRADPRWPWLEHARLARDLDTADAAQVRGFLQRHDGQAAANALRPLWLASLARPGWRRWRRRHRVATCRCATAPAPRHSIRRRPGPGPAAR